MATNYPKARDISQYLETFPNFRKPKHIGHYSIDGEGQYGNNDNEKKYLRMEDLQVDGPLEHPINLSFIEKKYVGFKEDSWFPLHILIWIRDHKQQVWLEDEQRLNEDFVTSGGTFKRIFLAPYTMKDQNFIVYSLNETFYLLAERQGDIKSDTLSNIGHKFELFLTSPDPDGQPNGADVIVNENRKYYHVKKSKINDYYIMYSVNIDCVEMVTNHLGKTEEKGVELTVLKNSIQHIDTFKFKRFRLLKMWCDAFATGIDKTIGGFRGDSITVTHLKIFETKNISQFSLKNIPEYKQSEMWRPNVCANFADTFFDFIKASNIDDRKLYRVTYTMDGDLKMSTAEDIKVQLLPAWYCKEFGNIGD